MRARRRRRDAGDPEATIEQRVRWHGQEVMLAVPGAHNALNASAALEAALLAGAAPEGAIAGLARFRGAERRFQLMGRARAGRVSTTITPITRARWRRR